MARPPLDIGTAGSMKTVKLGHKKFRTRVNHRDADGVTRKVERWGISKAEAERRMKAALKQRHYSGGNAQLTAESTVAELLATWWRIKRATKSSLSDGTRAHYEDTMARLIVPGMGAVKIREVTSQSLEVWLITERQTRAVQAELSRTILRQALKLAVNWSLLPANPAAGLTVIERTVVEPRALTEEELTLMRDVLRRMRQNLWLADAFEVQLGLGSRIGETLALRVGCLDLSDPERPLVTIDSTVIAPTGQKHRIQSHTKDGPSGSRTVVAPDWVVEIIQRRSMLAGPSGLVFATRNDTVLSPRNVRESWRRERARIGLDWVKPHHLRKTALTRIESVFGLTAASGFADHKSEKVTSDHYIVPGQNIGPDVRDALNQLAPPAPGRHLTLVDDEEEEKAS